MSTMQHDYLCRKKKVLMSSCLFRITLLHDLMAFWGFRLEVDVLKHSFNKFCHTKTRTLNSHQITSVQNLSFVNCNNQGSKGAMRHTDPLQLQMAVAMAAAAEYKHQYQYQYMYKKLWVKLCVAIFTLQEDGALSHKSESAEYRLKSTIHFCQHSCKRLFICFNQFPLMLNYRCISYLHSR